MTLSRKGILSTVFAAALFTGCSQVSPSPTSPVPEPPGTPTPYSLIPIDILMEAEKTFNDEDQRVNDYIRFVDNNYYSGSLFEGYTKIERVSVAEATDGSFVTYSLGTDTDGVVVVCTKTLKTQVPLIKCTIK